ncbi:MAG: WG repeat-containing protein, partial [Bacteroidia bacterium]
MKIPFFVIYSLLLGVLIAFSSCGSDGRTTPARLLAVKQAGMYGYINEKGVGVIKPNFVYAIDFAEGLGAVNIGGSAIGRDMPRNGKWGFINEKQQIIINPKYYSPAIYAPIYNPELLSYVLHEAYQFSEGLAAVRTEYEWIYINQKDSVVIGNLKIQAARKFSEGLAAIMINGRWGYIDKLGN